jgi:hypothetical protein
MEKSEGVGIPLTEKSNCKVTAYLAHSHSQGIINALKFSLLVEKTVVENVSASKIIEYFCLAA